jgi:hypothetical protein
VDVVATGNNPVTVMIDVADVLAAYALVPLNTAWMFCDPGPKGMRSVAVPVLVIHTLPKTAASSQCGALALQKFTKPAVTGVAPAATEAVNVTIVPAETLLDDTLSVVVVGVVVADAAPTKMTNAIKMRCHVVIVDVRATE